jgi:hypothetical protein
MGVVVVSGFAVGCDAVLGIPGDLRDREANGAIRAGGLSTLQGGPVSAKTKAGATLWLEGAALERRAPSNAPVGCAGGLCLRGTLSTGGGAK